jgi:hypothetical protein
MEAVNSHFIHSLEEEKTMVGTLISYDEKVNREVLAIVPVPEGTDTFQPIKHSQLVDSVEESLAYRHMQITHSEFALSKDGMKMFGLLQVNAEYEGVQFAIGLRNANDKSMRIGMVAGYKVLVCQNMSLSGDFKPLLAKHTKHFDLIEAVSMGVDRIHRGWEPLKAEIRRKREIEISKDDARLTIYNAFTRHKMPITLFKSVSGTYEASEEKSTLWNLEQHFTGAIKQLNPMAQFKTAAKLPRVLEAV